MGGGSGGHVTPVVAVLHELRADHPQIDVRFWCDKHFVTEARRILSDYDSSIRVQTVLSGKFRRYHHLSKLQHLTIPSVVFPNILDAFMVVFGVGQSLLRLLVWRPNAVFLKGGYVCLPVGYAAWLLRIPIVIHDSDAHPGLTNRLLAPLARKIATGVPLEYYDYPAAKSSYVGIPIDKHYRVLTAEERNVTKESLGFDPKRPLTVFVGGGLGAKQINDNVALHLKELLKTTNVILFSGTAQYDELRSLTPQNDPRFQLEAFVPPRELARILGAADVVVSRAGATFLLELSAMARPTIVIPSKRLIWQVKHAQFYVDQHAVYPLDENAFDHPGDSSLVDAVTTVLEDVPLREELAHNLHRLARPQAAHDLAAIIMGAARKRRR